MPLPAEADAKLLEWSAGNVEAARFLRMFADAVRWADDLVDGDSRDPAGDMAQLLNASWAGFAMNPFFHANAHLLAPCLALTVAKWRATEKWKQGPAKSKVTAFVVREECTLDVLYLVALICGGFNHASMVILDAHDATMSAETLAEYMEECHGTV